MQIVPGELLALPAKLAVAAIQVNTALQTEVLRHLVRQQRTAVSVLLAARNG